MYTDENCDLDIKIEVQKKDNIVYYISKFI